MPELPEVESVVRGLYDVVINRTIERFTSTWPRQIAPYSPAQFAARISGQQITDLWRRAKFVVFDLSDDVLLIHLKMTGRLYVTDRHDTHREDRWVRAVFGLDNDRELRFSDLRKFGRILLVSGIEEATSHLGPEPLSETFTLDIFAQRLALHKGAIKPLLLNQSFLAGVGNIYADEALWIARIDPRRKASTLNTDETESLYLAIRKVLADGIEHEGTSINWYRKPDGTAGAQQDHLNVYDHTGDPCPRCGTPIAKIRIAQRGTHICPNCQD